ncbi:MAG: pilus assembly protein PilP [Pseudomonadota bacterium]
MSRRFLLLLMALGLAACAGDHAELRQQIAAVKQSPGEQIEPLPTIETPETFEYEAMDLREPFAGAVSQPLPEDEEIAAIAAGPRPDFNRRKEVLEGFELDSLEMVGTYFSEESERFFGLVEDPDGLLHRVAAENYLGRNHGRIVAVFDDRIEVIELVADGAGGWSERDAALVLDEQ